MMPLAGRWISRGHGRRVATTGAVVVGLDYLLASAADSIEGLVLAYGVVGGLGVGLAYGVPLAVVASWFPERKGLAVGLTVTGFGLSPLITAPLAQRLIAGFGTRPTLRLFGLTFGAILLLTAWLLRPAPAGPATTLAATAQTRAAASVSLFAAFNGLSRPLFGWLCDRWQPACAAMLAFALILAGSLLMLGAGPGDVARYLVAFCLFWSALGGWLAIAPAATLRCFPADRTAEIYGQVFTAYGVGALMGRLITGQLRDWLGSYSTAFYPLAGLAAAGIVLAARRLPGFIRS